MGLQIPDMISEQCFHRPSAGWLILNDCPKQALCFQVGFVLDIFSIPLGVCRCHSFQLAPFPLVPPKKKIHTFTHLTNRKAAWRVAHLWHHCWLFSPPTSELSLLYIFLFRLNTFTCKTKIIDNLLIFLVICDFLASIQSHIFRVSIKQNIIEMTNCFYSMLFSLVFCPTAFWHYSGSSSQLIFQPVNVGTVNCFQCWSRAQIRNALAFVRLWFNER